MHEVSIIPHNPVQAVLFTERKQFNKEDRRILTTIRNRKIFILASSYVAFSGLLAIGWSYGRLKSYRFGEENVARFDTVAPILIGFFFIMLTIYFAKLYMQSAKPLIKDLAAGFKELIYFEPESYKTPFFEAYYIKTISKKRSMIRISKQMFDAIQPGCKACLCLAPFSRFVFYISVDEHVATFNEKNSMLEI